MNIKLDKLPEIFPVKAQANLSDKEVYFSVPISVSAEATAKTQRDLLVAARKRDRNLLQPDTAFQWKRISPGVEGEHIWTTEWATGSSVRVIQY